MRSRRRSPSCAGMWGGRRSWCSGRIAATSTKSWPYRVLELESGQPLQFHSEAWDSDRKRLLALIAVQ
eukprot:11978941-Alexandrium_andersonii.AAC.1